MLADELLWVFPVMNQLLSALVEDEAPILACFLFGNLGGKEGSQLSMSLVKLKHLIQRKRTTNVTMHQKYVIWVVSANGIFIVEDASKGIVGELLLKVVDLKVEDGPHLIQKRDELLLIFIPQQVYILHLL